MSELEDILRDKLNLSTLSRVNSIGGGCISSGGCYLIDNNDKIFVKTKIHQHAAVMFAGEFESLKQIKATNTIKVPKPIKVILNYNEEGTAAIAMEYLDMNPIEDRVAKILGQKLAELHDYNNKYIRHEEKVSSWVGKVKPSEKYLLQSKEETNCDNEQDNQEKTFLKHTSDHIDPQLSDESLITKFLPSSDLEIVQRFGFSVQTSCGLLPQVNEWTDDWINFYARHRLDHSIRLVLQEHHDRELLELWSFLQVKVDKFFDDYDKTDKIVPSLLHGDLWSGNIGQVENSLPVIYDPSSFYGHFEYEFGIARMFGGIPRSFENSYFEIMPRKKRFEIRNKLYQLYHQLNHWNHFGSGYRDSTLSLMRSLNRSV